MKSGAVIAAIAGLASAHMELKDPPAFRSRYNPHADGNVDYNIRSPLESDGSNFPCKGYYKQLLGTPAARPVAAWTPGRAYSMTVTGNTPHNGGSCQASLSYDAGASWTVIHSYIGNCPVRGDSSYPFTLPADAPPGDALFAWSWFNWGGNREMYMNCAAVTIEAGPDPGPGPGPDPDSDPDSDSGSGSGPGPGPAPPATPNPFRSRPAMFVANVGNGICTYEGADVEFPEPGPDVTRDTRGTRPPGRGSCNSWGGDARRHRRPSRK